MENCITYDSNLVGCVAASQVPSVSEEHVALIFKDCRFTKAFFMEI
jgi:hypothetical protein